MAAGLIGTGKNDKRVSAPGSPIAKKPGVRLQPQVPGVKGPKQRVFIAAGGQDEIEVTGTLTAAIAHALWQLRGGADIGNWVDAECLLDEVLLSGTPRGAVSTPAEVVVPGKRTTVRR